MLTLYGFHASCSLVSHFVLEESGCEYDTIEVNLGKNAQRDPAFLAINPKGRVPALRTERGIITETPAIIVYIAMRFPEAKLAPLTDPFLFARMQEVNAYLSSTVHVAHAHRMRGTRWADDPAAIAEMKRKTPETMTACFEYIDSSLIAGPWVLGEAYSVTDAYLFAMSRWLPVHGLNVTQFPNVNAHAQRVQARPAIARVLASLPG